MRSAIQASIVSLSFLALASAASAQSGFSTSTSSYVGVVNGANGGGITVIGQASGSGPVSSISASQSFTGLDRNGLTQTMTFSGTTVNSSDYGVLHAYTSGHLVNSYYNASNTAYADGNGGVTDPKGSPDGLASLGFSDFDDTLQFGGALQSGYKARYIFQVDGVNSGTGGAADLAVNIAGHENDFFDFDPGAFAATWATDDVPINGQTPQTIHVQFSNQVVFNTKDLTDGGTYDGLSDFSSTLRLSAIVVVDANGNPVSGVTFTSASGTIYPTPEPGSFAVLGLGALGILHRRRRARA